MGPRRVDTLRDALDSLVDPRRWPDGIKDYLTGYALEVLKRWGDGTRLIPDPWALMELDSRKRSKAAGSVGTQT